MKFLSTAPLPSFWDPSQTEGPPFFYRSMANHSYIVISIDDGSIHILSSHDGTLIPNQPPKGLTGDAKVAQVLLDGENLILGQGTPPALTVYNIPSGYVSHTQNPSHNWCNTNVKAKQKNYRPDRPSIYQRRLYLNTTPPRWKFMHSRCFWPRRRHLCFWHSHQQTFTYNKVARWDCTFECSAWILHRDVLSRWNVRCVILEYGRDSLEEADWTKRVLDCWKANWECGVCTDDIWGEGGARNERWDSAGF